MRQNTSANEWTLDQIPLGDIDTIRMREQEDLFYLVAAASFIEIAADVYTDNLIRYFGDNADVTRWLQEHWKPEEMRHGVALSSYVRHVWPEFNWEKAYQAFFEDYSSQCTMEELEPTQCLEMAARCVVETGTSTFYQALSVQTDEPVLAGIAQRIRAEEISHYKHFYQYFRMYQAQAPASRWRILGALKRRVLEARNSDAECAIRHAYAERNDAAAFDDAEFQRLCKRLSRRVQRHYPIDMATKMLMKPLDLPTGIARAIQKPMAGATRWLLR